MSDINVGAITEALNDKMDRDAHNVQSPSAVVVEKMDPTAGNNYTWYRKYSDGWIKQGGRVLYQSTAGNVTVTLPITMADANYQTSSSLYGNTSGHEGGVNGTYFSIWNRTTTSFTTKAYNAQDIQQMWEVEGMAA